MVTLSSAPYSSRGIVLYYIQTVTHNFAPLSYIPQGLYYPASEYVMFLDLPHIFALETVPIQVKVKVLYYRSRSHLKELKMHSR